MDFDHAVYSVFGVFEPIPACPILLHARMRCLFFFFAPKTRDWRLVGIAFGRLLLDSIIAYCPDRNTRVHWNDDELEDRFEWIF